MPPPPPNKSQQNRARALATQTNQSLRDSTAAKALFLPFDSASSSRGSIQTENTLERTWKAKQRDILLDADDSTKAKAMDLRLNASYSMRFTKSGRHAAFGGKENGHVAVVDALRFTVRTEVVVEKDCVHDVAPLHDHTMVAAAQNKHLFVYDSSGVEILKMKSHIEPRRIEFLPYHYLLASVGRSSRVVYQDVSTGELVASLRTKMGPCSVLAQNRATGVLGTGHSNGVVAFWAPKSGDALVKMLCHPAAVTGVRFDRSGTKMVTASLDGLISIWDVRKFGEKLNSYRVRPQNRTAQCLAVSDTGMVAVGTSGNEVVIWKDVFGEKRVTDPYLSHKLPGGNSSKCLDFRPYEDVLGIGHSGGIQTIIVPGAGEANFDTYEANPYERASQRRENEIRKLLDKLPADTIGLDTLGEVAQTGLEKNAPKNVQVAAKRLDELEKIKIAKRKKRNGTKELVEEDEQDDTPMEDRPSFVSKILEGEEEKLDLGDDRPVRRKMKGRGRIGSRLKVKRRNIITEEREKRRLNEVTKRHTSKLGVASDDLFVKDESRPGKLAMESLMKKQKR